MATKSIPELQRILKCGTLASGNPGDGETPIIAMDLADTIAVKRFAEASIQDLLNQLNFARKEGKLKPYEFKDMVSVSQILCGWLSNVIATCDDGIRNLSDG